MPWGFFFSPTHAQERKREYEPPLVGEHPCVGKAIIRREPGEKATNAGAGYAEARRRSATGARGLRIRLATRVTEHCR